MVTAGDALLEATGAKLINYQILGNYDPRAARARPSTLRRRARQPATERAVGVSRAGRAVRPGPRPRADTANRRSDRPTNAGSVSVARSDGDGDGDGERGALSSALCCAPEASGAHRAANQSDLHKPDPLSEIPRAPAPRAPHRRSASEKRGRNDLPQRHRRHRGGKWK